MKKQQLIALLFIGFNLFLYAQKTDFTKSFIGISSDLTNNANYVVRSKSTNVNIVSTKSMIIDYDMVVTVLNEAGEIDPFFYEGYDNHTTIHSIQILVYNAMGKRIKKVKSKEINDVSATQDFTLHSDNRIKYYKHITNSYPYTLSIKYKVRTSNTAFIPKWFPINSFYQSVEKDTYSITYPKDVTLNYDVTNVDEFNIDKSITANKITFKATNIKAISKEDYMPSFSKTIPNVSFSLSEFSLAGEIGNASSWEEFGLWMYEKLLKGRNELPESTKKDIDALIIGINNPMERAKLVYAYMQNRTRYISVQIGIGGWKPMLANEVDKLGYGDCKALSNYTQSLMEHANVPSVYTIVYSGR